MPSLETLRKRIQQRLRDMSSLVDASYPPDLSGQAATDFTTEANAMKADCDDILTDAFFTGITPSTIAPDTSMALIEWCESIEQDAYDILGLPSPTTAQKQEAADIYLTLSGQADDLIAFYT